MPFPGTWGETRRLMWRHRVAILCTGIVVGGVVTAWMTHLPDQYRASALLALKVQNFPEEYVRLMTTERAEAQIHVVREVLLSRSLLGRVVDDFRLYENLRATRTPEEILDAMRRDVTVRLKGNDLFVIAYQGEKAETVAAVTNHLAELFVGVLKNEVKPDPVRHHAQFLEARLKVLEKQLADLLLVYTPSYPEVIGIRRQIQEVGAELDDEQRRIQAGLVPADAPERQRRPEGGAWQEAKILDRAIVPEKPSGPHRVLVSLAGFLVGGVIGIAWALIRSLMDQSFRDVYDVEAVTRIPVLGVVSRLEAPRQRHLVGLILGVGSGVATAGGAWYLAWHLPEVGRWVAQWWRSG